MTLDVFPRRNLPAAAEPWGRKHDEVVRQLVRNFENLKLATHGDNRATAGQMGVVGRQLETLAEQQQELSDQQVQLNTQVSTLDGVVSQLSDAANFYTNSSGATHTGTGWFPSPPSVTASSRSRRFRVSVSGGAAGGQALFTFSTTGYSRDRALGGSSSAILSRVTAFGGASVSGSAYRSWVVTMPGTGNYTFTAQGYNSDGYTSIVGLQIDVEPLL